MAPKKPARKRKTLDLRRSTSAYPIGTRIADGYKMDLDREARDGIPGDRLGMPAAEPIRPQSRFRRWLDDLAYLSLVILTLLVIVGIALHFFVARWKGLDRYNLPQPGLSETHHYADVRAAGRSGALTEGWVPSFIPDGATDIDERHHNSTGEGWVVFRFPSSQGRWMTDRLTRVPPDKLFWLVVGGPNEAWWPDSLQGRVALRKTGTTWEIFRTSRHKTGTQLSEYVAIDWKGSRACLWRESR